MRKPASRPRRLPGHQGAERSPASPALRDTDSTTVGNQFTFGRIRFPVQLADPVQVLTDLHVATERPKTDRRSNAKKICFFFNNRHGSTGFKIVDEPA
jgi:diacylglycerol O-acyltransferase